MRIISGKARGTKLYTLEGIETRPTLDRVKESMFNIIKDKISGTIVLDLFAGSGAIGLEFASRGAKKAILCDNSKDAIKIINKNIEKTHLQDVIEIYNCSFEQLLKTNIKEHLDIIYIDPPYKTSFIKDAIEILTNLKFVDKNTLIICETDEPERVIKETNEYDINIIDQRKYGRASLIFVQKN